MGSSFIEAISQYITADYIALTSVIITVLIFVFSRRSELKYKKHEDKKIQYVKLIKLQTTQILKMLVCYDGAIICQRRANFTLSTN